MLREIQRKHYLTMATSQTNEINDWLESPPIQEPVPDNMTAEQDILWLSVLTYGLLHYQE